MFSFQVDIDVNVEHPFFVYGKGWSSFNPDGTQQKFGLKCQKLQVGDICISLKPRSGDKEKLRTQSEPKPAYQPYREFEYPQNLSRRPHTVSTTATGTTVSSRPAPPVDAPTHLMSTIPYPNHILELQRSANFHSGGGGNCINGGIPQIIEPSSHNHNGNVERRPLSHETPSLHERYSAALMGMMLPGSPGNNGCGGNGGGANDQPISMVVNKHLISDEAAAAAAALEAEASRKRRWSAPDNIDDETEQRLALLHGKYSH